MSAARKLITQARRIGASFRLEGDRLRLVPSPGRTLPDDLVREARAHEQELVSELRKLAKEETPQLALRGEQKETTMNKHTHNMERIGQQRTILDASGRAPQRATVSADRELSWFADRVERGRAGPYVEIVTITPAIAARLLDLNDGNRPVSKRQVDEIAADIENGYWKLNGETIIVSRDGFLNDGQNRLHAVLKAGIEIQSAVMFGVERESRMTVDMGRQRTAGNFLAMSGAANSNNAASISKLLLNYSRGKYFVSEQPTKSEIREFYDRHERAIDAAIKEAIHNRFSRVIGITAFGAAHVILHRANAVEATVFMSRLLDGTNLKKTDPILFLRSRMLNDKPNRVAAQVKLELILRYWNHWRRGTSLKGPVAAQSKFPEVIS